MKKISCPTESQIWQRKINQISENPEIFDLVLVLLFPPSEYLAQLHLLLYLEQKQLYLPSCLPLIPFGTAVRGAVKSKKLTECGKKSIFFHIPSVFNFWRLPKFFKLGSSRRRSDPSVSPCPSFPLCPLAMLQWIQWMILCKWPWVILETCIVQSL